MKQLVRPRGCEIQNLLPKAIHRTHPWQKITNAQVSGFCRDSTSSQRKMLRTLQRHGAEHSAPGWATEGRSKWIQRAWRARAGDRSYSYVPVSAFNEIQKPGIPIESRLLVSIPGVHFTSGCSFARHIKPLWGQSVAPTSCPELTKSKHRMGSRVAKFEAGARGNSCLCSANIFPPTQSNILESKAQRW